MFLTLHQYGWIQPATLASVAVPRQIKRSVHCSPPLIFVYYAFMVHAWNFHWSNATFPAWLTELLWHRTAFPSSLTLCSFFIPFPLFLLFPMAFSLLSVCTLQHFYVVLSLPPDLQKLRHLILQSDEQFVLYLQEQAVIFFKSQCIIRTQWSCLHSRFSIHIYNVFAL